MLTVLDPDEVRGSAHLLVEFVKPESARPELSAGYFAALNRVQPRPFRTSADGGGPFFDFEVLHPVNLPIVRHFLKVDRVTEEHAFSEDEQAEIREEARAGFELLERYDPRVVEAIDLLVGCFLCARESGVGGGSFGDSLGVVWFDPSPSWDAVDYAETILHEATHQGVFLRDMVRRLFVREPREMTGQDALVLSAVLKTRRPYDLAFHSACVAAALADFFAKAATPERSRKFLEPLKPTVAELRSKDHLLTDAGLALLGELERCVADLDELH